MQEIDSMISTNIRTHVSFIASFWSNMFSLVDLHHPQSLNFHPEFFQGANHQISGRSHGETYFACEGVLGWFYVSGIEILYLHLDVSKNTGAPKWMVYNGKPY